MTTAPKSRMALWYTLVLVLAVVATVAVLMLLDNIRQRQHEAQAVAVDITRLTETTIDPKEWGKTFPREYDTYVRTVDIQRTRFGGSEAFQKLDEDPDWRTIFAGYAFGIDYREERGHAFMLSDQRETERITKKSQPGACLHCHASTTVAYRTAGIEAGAPGSLDMPLASAEGQAQLFRGFEKVNALPYVEATKLVQHPVTCLDCHDPKSLALRVTRPGFITGIQKLAESDDPLPHLPSVERWRQGKREKPYDANTLASRQEMRTLACAQCHVEYYFKGDQKLLTFPWHKGLKVEQIQEYYDEVGFTDWKHAKSGAPVLKAQHPEFEMWSQGIHARAGVACADCHMPYKREGAIKFSDHHIRSPLLNINRACQTCHAVEEGELLARAGRIQERTRKLMDRAEDAVVQLIGDIEKAAASGVADADLEGPRKFQRLAQFRLDFCAAENSMGFHADQEYARILGESIDYARQGQIELLTKRRAAQAP